MKNILVLGGVIIVVIVGYVAFKNYEPVDDSVPTDEGSVVEVPDDGDDMEVPEEVVDETRTVIGASVDGHDITAFHYGTGETEVLFVGGIHGGYSWNTALLAYELMEYLEENPEAVPSEVKVTVIPVLNPDGLQKVTGSTGEFSPSDVSTVGGTLVAGRFNGNTVDLNRNFDCDWQSEGMWQSREVSGGSEAFSEPESRAIRDYVQTQNPDAVVVWYSAAGGVYASNCHGGVLPETEEMATLYGEASGYPVYQEYNYYEITGDMTNWLASEDVPAISVLLTNHEDIEWEKNKAGVDALLQAYVR